MQVFARKYQRIAKAYTDCVFLECTGDETIDLRVGSSGIPSVTCELNSCLCINYVSCVSETCSTG